MNSKDPVSPAEVAGEDLGMTGSPGMGFPDDGKVVEERWWKDTKIWINLIGYIAVTGALVAVKMYPEIMPKVDRGFHCDDKYLRFPIKPDSIQQRTLIISTVSILLMSIFISEGVYSISPEYQPQPLMDGLDVPLKDKVVLFVNLVISKLLYSYLGLILTMNLTFYTQHLSAGLRPNFLMVCELRRAVCTTSGTVVQLIHCQQRNKELLMDARMSFPSEYASISFYMTVFSCLIIERAISNDFFALKLAVQSSYIFWAVYVSTSRIKDHKNHPSDTLAGCVMGTLIAFLMDYLATYQEYQDMGMGYDQSNIAINLHDWDEGEQPLDEHGEIIPLNDFRLQQ